MALIPADSLDFREGHYMVFHDPNEPPATFLRSLEGVYFCPGKGSPAHCPQLSSYLHQYCHEYLEMKAAHHFQFDVNVIHWMDGSDMRHSLLVGPIIFEEGPKDELFKQECGKISKISVEFGIRENAQPLCHFIDESLTLPEEDEDSAKWSEFMAEAWLESEMARKEIEEEGEEEQY